MFLESWGSHVILGILDLNFQEKHYIWKKVKQQCYGLPRPLVFLLQFLKATYDHTKIFSLNLPLSQGNFSICRQRLTNHNSLHFLTVMVMWCFLFFWGGEEWGGLICSFFQRLQFEGIEVVESWQYFTICQH